VPLAINEIDYSKLD